MGSPLGLPTVMSKFTSENPVTHKAKVPDNLERWINFADLNDFVALDPTLENDFAPSAAGVSPVDLFIHNSYHWDGLAYPHAVFGYLQSPECASTIYEFLTRDHSNVSMAFNYLQQSIRERIFLESKKRRNRSMARDEKISNIENADK